MDKKLINIVMEYASFSIFKCCETYFMTGCIICVERTRDYLYLCDKNYNTFELRLPQVWQSYRVTIDCFSTSYRYDPSGSLIQKALCVNHPFCY